MKKFLLLTFLFGVLCASKSLAQPCSLKNFQVVSISANASGQCTATISFDMDRNNGNKYVYIHLWNDAEWAEVDKSKFTKGHGPLYNDINGSGNSHPSLATVALNNMDFNNPTFLSSYKPDNSVVPVIGSSVTVSSTEVSKGFYRYTVAGIPLGTNVSGGCVATNINAAIWSTQSNSKNSPIHCSLLSSTSTPQDPVNLVVTGSSNCATGMYTLNIQNTSSTSTVVEYDIYADNGGGAPDNILDPANDTRIDGAENITIAGNTTYTVTRPVPNQYKAFDLWAIITYDVNNTISRVLPASACGALPVTLKAFDAKRNNKNVQVKWETSTEQNVKGYHVQRNTNGVWENVGFVSSNSADGNSSVAQSYQYIDVNNIKGISQYRIQMVEYSGAAKVSEVRSVRGENQVSKLMVYPNPSSNGKIYVVFDDTETSRDVFVSDMSGKLIRQWRTVNNNNLQIDNLLPGMYTLKVVDNASGNQSIEKLVINKR